MKQCIFLVLVMLALMLSACSNYGKSTPAEDTIINVDAIIVDTENTEVKIDTIRQFAFDTIIEYGTLRIPVAPLPLSELVEDPFYQKSFADLQELIIDRYDRLDNEIVSVSSFNYTTPNTLKIYYKSEKYSYDNNGLPFDLVERVRKASVGDKEAWDALDRIVWKQCQLTSEVTDNRIKVIGYQYPSHILMEIMATEERCPTYLRIGKLEYDHYIPFSDNLLEEFLRHVSDGNLSLVNIENDSLASRYLVHHYYKQIRSLESHGFHFSSEN